MDSLFDYISVTFPEISVEDKPIQQEISDLYTSQITIDDIETQMNETLENIQIQDNSTNNVVSKETLENTIEKDESSLIEDALLEEALAENSLEESTSEPSSPLPEKVLFISHKKGYAILPYSTSDLEKTFSDSPEKYSSLQNIIDKEYTISLKDYKFDSSSVYDECYN
jgi:hypothetical protein